LCGSGASHSSREGCVIDTWQAACEDQDAVVKLTRELVRIPSRGGIDPYEPVLDCMSSWLAERGLACRFLRGHGGETVALACEVEGAAPGPRYVLDACLDTAPFGDETCWTCPPASGEITDGWMHGRGTADSKAGAAIFAHVAARLHAQAVELRGSAVLLLDVDEHTGHFGGAKAFFEADGDPAVVDGVMIGYPGLDHLVTGGRGVLRAILRVHGVASHSGGSKVTPSAVAKAAALVSELHAASLPGAKTRVTCSDLKPWVQFWHPTGCPAFVISGMPRCRSGSCRSPTGGPLTCPRR
jgi:succinyl-diaminopimelate desuccinylase